MNRVPDIGLISLQEKRIGYHLKRGLLELTLGTLSERNGGNPVILTEPLANQENLTQSIPKELVRTETPIFKHWSGVT